MKLYHIVLFIHICALLAAIATSALSHYSVARMQAASTVGEVRSWVPVIGNARKIFPIALLTLVASGAYMVSKAWSWSAGWVNAALIGVVLLFISGVFVGFRFGPLRRALEGDASAPVSPTVTRILRDPLTNSLAWANTFLAIGIVYIMTNKPGLGDSLIALVVAMAIGVVVAIPSWRGGSGARTETSVRAGARERS